MTTLTPTRCARCLLSAGLVAGLVATGGQVLAPATDYTPTLSAAAVALSAAALPLESDPVEPVVPTTQVDAAQSSGAGDFLIAAYNLIEPYVQWGFELAAWAVSYLPWPIGWLGQQINIAYDSLEPIAQALVYSVAFLLDGQYDLIVPVLTNGINAAVTYFVQGEIAWVLSFLPPLPPGPPFPIFPSAAVAPAAAVSGAADETTPIAGQTPAPSEAAPEDSAPGELRRGAVRAQRAGAVRADGVRTAEAPAEPLAAQATQATQATDTAAPDGEATSPAAGDTPDRDTAAAAGGSAGTPAKAAATRASRRG